MNDSHSRHNKKSRPGFADLIIKAKEIAGSRLALAKALGVANATVIGWEKGADPGSEKYQRLIDYVEKRPAVLEPHIVYDHEQVEHVDREEQGFFISGQVAAGKVTFAGEDQHVISLGSLWAKSRYWPLTTGQVIFVEVHGDSMAPQYQAGEILACRTPANAMDLPNGTPCIFQEGEEDGFTFKLLHKTEGHAYVIGQPLNPAFDVVMFKAKQVRIPLVVVGKVQLEKRDLTHTLAVAAASKKQKR